MHLGVSCRFGLDIMPIEMPLYAMVYILLVIGLIIGLLIGLSKRFGQSRTIRSLQREINGLKIKAKNLEEKKAVTPAQA